MDFVIDDFPADELDAILDAAANLPIRPPVTLNTPKVYSNPEDPFEVMFIKHLRPLCHTYDPNEPGQIAHGHPRYLNWKLEKHAYAHCVKLIKQEKCYVQEMDEYFLKHDHTNLAMHSIYPGAINNGYELGAVYAYAEHHPGSTTDVSCRGDRWHTHCLTVNQARYHSTKGAWIARLEPPKFRRVVFRQLVKHFTRHRHCAGPLKRRPNAFNILMRRPRHPRSWQEHKPESAKAIYQRLLCSLKIRNDKQYDEVIANNKQLKDAESLMNPASVAVVKKLIYNQNLFKDFVPHNKLLPEIKIHPAGNVETNFF